MGGDYKRTTGESECGGTVLWDAARIEWALGPIVFALIVFVLASFPPSGVPVGNGGGSVSFETTGERAPVPGAQQQLGAGASFWKSE